MKLFYRAEMNLTWRLYRRDDHQWGVKQSDGSFNGMVGSLKKGDAEMIAATLTATDIRHQAVDFGVNYANL